MGELAQTIASLTPVQAAEGGTSANQHALYRTLKVLGVAPPYWRFLPAMLSFPPLHLHRSRYPSLLAGKPAGALCEA